MEDVQNFIPLVSVAISLVTLAGSAVAYVVKLYLDRNSKRRGEFFELMQFIDNPNMPIATKVAAVYELRRYPEHKDFVVRFLTGQRDNIAGGGAEFLRGEMNETLAFLARSSQTKD